MNKHLVTCEGYVEDLEQGAVAGYVALEPYQAFETWISECVSVSEQLASRICGAAEFANSLGEFYAAVLLSDTAALAKQLHTSISRISEATRLTRERSNAA